MDDPASQTEGTPPVDQQASGEQPPDELAGAVDEIERAYRKALMAVEDLPWIAAGACAATTRGELLQQTEQDVLRPDAGHAPVPPSYSAALRLAPGTAQPSEESSAVTPAQVIEAALFVGGMPLSAAKIGALLRGAVENNSVEQTIDELNRQYIAEGRPYEIRLGDGGYRLELRPEFDKLRNRVYGAGPREVRLSQDALEVLALVAYQQPISQAQIEAHGKQQAGNLLRQLLRRELVAIERGPGGRKDIKYVTTARFLSVFGLGSLAELPEPEDLARR